MVLAKEVKRKQPKLTRRRIHPADDGLPEHLRRCLDADHEGKRVLHINEFSPTELSQKGREYKCRTCRSRTRKENRRKENNRRKAEGFWPRQKKTGPANWYKIVSDPDRLFSGKFGVYDFLLSFAGQVWTEGSAIEDQNGEHYKLTYKPLPMMLRTDGAIFGMFTRGDKVKMKRTDSQPWTHTWYLRNFRPDLNGKRCRILVAYRRKALYEFETGELVVSHSRSVRRIKD